MVRNTSSSLLYMTVFQCHLNIVVFLEMGVVVFCHALFLLNNAWCSSLFREITVITKCHKSALLSCYILIYKSIFCNVCAVLVASVSSVCRDALRRISHCVAAAAALLQWVGGWMLFERSCPSCLRRLRLYDMRSSFPVHLNASAHPVLQDESGRRRTEEPAPHSVDLLRWLGPVFTDVAPTPQSLILI